MDSFKNDVSVEKKQCTRAFTASKSSENRMSENKPAGENSELSNTLLRRRPTVQNMELVNKLKQLTGEILDVKHEHSKNILEFTEQDDSTSYDDVKLNEQIKMLRRSFEDLKIEVSNMETNVESKSTKSKMLEDKHAQKKLKQAAELLKGKLKIEPKDRAENMEELASKLTEIETIVRSISKENPRFEPKVSAMIVEHRRKKVNQMTVQMFKFLDLNLQQVYYGGEWYKTMQEIKMLGYSESIYDAMWDERFKMVCRSLIALDEFKSSRNGYLGSKQAELAFLIKDKPRVEPKVSARIMEDRRLKVDQLTDQMLEFLDVIPLGNPLLYYGDKMFEIMLEIKMLGYSKSVHDVMWDEEFEMLCRSFKSVMSGEVKMQTKVNKKYPCNLSRPKVFSFQRSLSINSQENIPADYKITIDCIHFKPSELTVTVKGDRVLVQGSHSLKPDEHGFVERRFSRSWPIPKDVKKEKFSCRLDHYGILTIKAPRKPTSISIPVLTELKML